MLKQEQKEKTIAIVSSADKFLILFEDIALISHFCFIMLVKN